MRKVLLFLALLGIGLAALLLLRERVHKSSPSGPRPVPPVANSQFTKIPVPAEGSGKEGAPLEIVQRGKLDVTQFEGEGAVKKPIRKLHADDSRSLGGNLYVLNGMTVQLLDPETGKTTAQLTSPKTRLKIELVDGNLRLGELDRAVLTDAEATIFAHAAVTPLTLKIPVLEWHIADERWLSESPVEILGADSSLKAHGEGLDADLKGGTVILKRSGRIDLTLPGNTIATLSSTGEGPIEFRNVREDDQNFVWIIASKGARLSAKGEELSHLDADVIRLKAREGAGETKRFELVSVQAEGHVVADSRGDTFRADEAIFRVTPAGRLERADLDGSVSFEGVEGSLKGAKATFDFAPAGPITRAHLEQGVVIERGGDAFHSESADFRFAVDGKLAHATLVGAPTGRVAIGRYLPSGERELRAAHPQISGVGPLELDFSDGTRFKMTGPGRIEAQETGLEIDAQRSLEGSVLAEHKSGDFTADGSVVVKWRGDDLESDTVHFTMRTNEAGETTVDAQGAGPTNVHRRREDGSTLTMTALQGLETSSSPKSTIVRVARGVTITTTGAEALTATADTVHDFDWEAQTFSAEGNVTLDGSHGRGSANRVVSRGKNDVELTGTPEAKGSPSSPARYARIAGEAETRFEEASIQGLSIRATEESLDATGEVRMDLAAAGATYHLQGGEVHTTFERPKSPEPGAPRAFEAHASSAVHVQIDTAKDNSSLASERLRVKGNTKGTARPGAAPAVADTDIRAEGAVVVDWRGDGAVSGEGDLFTMDPQGRGQLSADPGKRVHARGRMAGELVPYSLVADWFEFEKERLEARRVDLRTEPTDAGSANPAGKPLVMHMTADHLLVTSIEALLEGNAHIDGLSRRGEDWAIDAGAVKVGGAFSVKKGEKPAELELVQAWNGFRAKLSTRAYATGKILEGKLSGVRIEGEPAELAFGSMALKSAWIEYNAESMLLASDKGELGPPKTTGEPWSITYESLQPFDKGDKSILALRNPVYHNGDAEMRALWMLFWVDREEWRRSGRKALNEAASGEDLRVQAPEPDGGESEVARAKKAQSGDRGQKKIDRLRADIARFRTDPLSKVLSEAYIEGNVELTDKGERRARASAVYLDLVDGNGWLRDADFLETVNIRNKEQQLRIRAEWMRISTDLSIRADKATLTFCGYDTPHYVVETGDLRLKLKDVGVLGFDVSATHNALRFENGWAIPLPPLIYAEDEEGNPIVENISLGKSAKFGASVGASFNVGLGGIGNGLGGIFAKMLSLPKTSVKGHWRFNADYLGTRGILLGTGLELRSGDQFKLNADFSFIPDRGEDHGIVRVPTDERSLLRDWFRVRGRYTLSKDQWFDMAISRQSDPGVQSEFFERDYISYEQKDNYLHWRKASGEWYLSSSVKVLLENRTDIEELPKFGVFRGRAPVGRLFGLDLLYTGYLDTAYLRRRQGDPEFYAPFNDPYGDREVARIDTDHRLEAPIPLDFGGLRATPWIEVRGTAWDRGVDPDTTPSRDAAFAGFDLATTIWKRYGSGYLHTLSPFVSVHGDVASQESDGVPVRFDRTEDPIEGRFVDVGLRTRIWSPLSPAHFDAEIRASHGTNLPNGQPDGMQPTSVLAELLTWLGNVPVGISHDGRYDTQNQETIYSQTFLGLRPFHAWDIEFGYHRGVDPSGVLLYEAASAGTRYRASQKWELELAETVSVLSNQGLSSNFILRRLGHDFVTEIQTSYTAGEGTSFSINLTPLITWKSRGIGLLDRWLGR